MKRAILIAGRILGAVVVAMFLAATAYAAVPGITGGSGSTATFNLVAAPAYITQPDGASIYSWGYGCDGSPAGFVPSAIPDPYCHSMQIPGPTLVVTEGQTVTVNLRNSLPNAAGNTSILFPGFKVTAGATFDSTSGNCLTKCGVPGLLTQEVAPGNTVTYTFTADTPGTRAYYSGTQGDLQIDMGLYGAIIVLPANVPDNCNSSLFGSLAYYNRQVEIAHGESDFRLADSAYDHPATCYDREYLFQFSEMDPAIHTQAEQQVAATGTCTVGTPSCSLHIATEPYHPRYFLINGRSMPDLMDPNYGYQYPHQPYNADPHMHPGERMLVRLIGTGRWQHPLHEHGNHVRTLGHDGNLILSNSEIAYKDEVTDTGTMAHALAGPVLFTTSTVPGQATEGIFLYTGKGLNWDLYGHNAADPDNLTSHPPCVPDANGYYTERSSSPPPLTAINYYEWCQDHLKPLEAEPFGDVGAGGPATLPDPNILTNGAWYGGSPYLGPDATTRATFGQCTTTTSGTTSSTSCSTTGTTPPSGTVVNPPSTEAAFGFIWHSHNERELTTNNIFPGGQLMIMLVDSREFVIDETN